MDLEKEKIHYCFNDVVIQCWCLASKSKADFMLIAECV